MHNLQERLKHKWNKFKYDFNKMDKHIIKRFDKDKILYFDFSLLFLMIFLMGFGLVMLYSVSSYDAQSNYGDAFYYIKKQALFAVAGIVIMVLVAFINSEWIKFLSGFVWITAVLLNLMVLFVGESSNGSDRWISIGDIRFQPSETGKIAIIVFLAAYLCKRTKSMQNPIRRGLAFVPWVGIIVGLIFKSNLSTAIIVFIIGFFMVFMTKPSFKRFLAWAALGVTAIYLFIEYICDKYAEVPEADIPYRWLRILIWRDPYAYDKGFQVIQAQYAIGSGGFFGKGLGNSIQKLGTNIPEVQNDMIFSVICEELGLFGAILIVLVFCVFLWRLYILMINASDLFGSYLVMGVFIHIALQVIMNIAVATNSMPNTGVTLPFFSYGGTALLVMLAEMGLVFNVSLSTQVRKPQPRGKVND